MAVTADKYELPVCVKDKARDLARWAGVTEGTIHSAIGRKTTGRITGIRYIKVVLEEE